jgi:serine protease Do
LKRGFDTWAFRQREKMGIMISTQKPYPEKRQQGITPLFPLALMLILFHFYFVSPAFSKTGAFSPSPENFSELAKSASPAVVNIRTERILEGGGPVFDHYYKTPDGNNTPPLDPFPEEDAERNDRERSLGSGFIIDAEGHIATNHHVIYNADRIKVRLQNGKEYDAEIVGSDPDTDLALIKIYARQKLPSLPMGNSDDLKIGHWVTAIGSPFGLENTVTVGIVSAKSRVIGTGAFDDFIQTDACINPGNSGGPLLNVNGEVVGVTTAMLDGSYGIGFAIPVNMAKEVFRQLKLYGKVSRGWIGIKVNDMNDSVREYYGVLDRIGVLVTEVYEEQPADEGGVEVNDILREINGYLVKDQKTLAGLISAIPVGETVQTKVFRHGKQISLKVMISRREDVNSASLKPTKGPACKFGMKVGELSGESARPLNSKDSGAVVVETVEKDGSAKVAGIQEGDLIREINHEEVRTMDDYKRIVMKIKKGEKAKLLVDRAKTGYVVLDITR